VDISVADNFKTDSDSSDSPRTFVPLRAV